MLARPVSAVALALAVATGGAPASGAALILPFAARYAVNWKSINVGTSDLVLESDAAPGSYAYTWTITARGVFRLVYNNDVIQRSWFSIVDDQVRPRKYSGEQGAASVSMEFDWDGGRVRGESEKESVDLELKEGTFDLLSIQIQVMLDLRNGNLPGTFRILEKDQIKEFIYTQQGPARLRTALGELDTLIVASRRAGSNRVLRMWFAPSLGYVPVQAERSRDGRLEFAMRIKTLQR